MNHSLPDDSPGYSSRANSSPIASSSDDRRPKTDARPRWHLVYFALAGFDLLTVLLGLYLSHRVADIYTGSVAVNHEWADRLGQYNRLHRLASAVNAPGNNVFDSHDVAAESATMGVAQRAFDEGIAAARNDLAQHVPPEIAATLIGDLATIRAATDDMIAEARLIFSFFETHEPIQAGKRMATMDRKYDLVNEAFGRLNGHVRDIQASHFSDQIAAARTVQRFEWVIAALILLMVIGATAYGHHLFKQAGARERERDREQRLQIRLQSEQRFRALVEYGSDIILMIDEARTVRYASPSVTRVLGYQPDDLVGQSASAVIHPDDKPGVIARCDQSLREPDTDSPIEFRVAHRDGSWRTLETIIKAGLDPSGAARLILSARDITERKEAEAEHRSIEARLTNILSIAADAIISVDDDQRILIFNQGAEQVFGFRAEEVIGQPLDLIIPDRVAKTHREHVRAFGAGPGSSRRMGERQEIAGRRKDGTEFQVEASISRITEHGRTIYTAILRDITEHKRAEKALQKSERRLADSQRIAHLGSWELDLGNNVLWWSDEVYRIFEIDPQAFGASYETFLETVHPDDREFVNRAYTESVQTRTPYDIVHRLLMKDGRVKYVNECCETEYDVEGKPTRSIGTVRDITERQHAEETIRQLAYCDSLTSLPNRALLHDRLTQAILTGQRESKPVAFVLMDIDRFKDINNTLGHPHGDLLLRQMGPRLQEMLRQTDTIARMGGDEFAILLPDTDGEGARQVVAKLQQALEAPFAIDGLTVTVEASMGIALYPEHGSKAETLIQRADVAMYAAKHGGGGYVVYSTEQDHYSPHRLALIGELRYAIEHDDLVLHYQPKIHLQTGRVIGVEALVRWQHQHRGLIPPDEFIPLAERTGLIKPLTLSVVIAALRQAQMWHRDGLRLSVAVNLSARNLQDPQLPEQVARLLQSAGVAPACLELEITESTIMADPARALDVLTRLDRMGLVLAIDDFGTGYSSLGYLKRLPVSSIKIDKSFVRNMAADDNDAVIVRSTIELAHNLGLTVVAEGVETQYLWDRLAALGCDAAQGYYMSQPMPASDLTRWFHESPWKVTMVVEDAEAA